MADYGVWQMIGVLFTMCTFALLIPEYWLRPIKSAYLRARSIVRPNDALCPSLRWSDVPAGRVHTCLNRCCQHPHIHTPAKKCWTISLGDTFNNGWKNVTLVQKPRALASDFDNNFLRIDLRTFIAFLLCAAPERSCPSWRVYLLEIGALSADIREYEGVLIAHVHGGLQQHALARTKNELEMVMNGYPPFFRDSVRLDHGPVLSFPIRDHRDIPRGGWIIMVGMMNLQRDKPLSLYTVPMHNNSGPDGFIDGAHDNRTCGRPFRRAVSRVEEVIQLIEKSFPGDENIKMVLAALQYMLRTGTGSGVERHLPGRSPRGVINTRFDADTCRYVMQLFNDLTPLEASDVQRLRPILASVLQVAFSGAYEVIQYLKDTGMRLDLPKLLQISWDRPVYLKDCHKEEY
ncbi:hypothetical protein IFR05_013525 [Cadophora sp. M221]|nr:hypothetical protein IFR05_013525 [Cadophora sp. M221]